MPGEKGKIKPMNISKRIHLTEDKTTFDKKVLNFLNQGNELFFEIKEKVQTKTFHNADNDKDPVSAQLFEQNYGDVIQKEMAAMFAGPKEHSSDGALEWLETFPHLIALIGSSYPLAKVCLSGRADFSKEHFDLAREWYLFLQDGHLGSYESNTVAHTGALINESFVKRENDLYDKAWKAVHKTEKTKIDSIVEKLENAKTFYNSGEYNQIIDVAKMLYHTDELPKKFKEKAGNTPEERHAFKLASIKARIDAYIEHKAKDGVKPNVYHKLAAVEELNRYVSEELNRIGVEHIPGGLPPITTVNGQVPVSLEEEPNAALLNSYCVSGRSMLSDEGQECRRTLDCMGRIMLSANALNLGEETMGKLDQLATAFQKGPDVELDAPQGEPKVPKDMEIEDLEGLKPLTSN